MAWDQWKWNIGKFPFHHMEIRATDATDVNLDEDLASLRDWYRPIVKPQRTAGDIARLIEHHRFH